MKYMCGVSQHTRDNIFSQRCRQMMIFAEFLKEICDRSTWPNEKSGYTYFSQVILLFQVGNCFFIYESLLKVNILCLSVARLKTDCRINDDCGGFSSINYDDVKTSVLFILFQTVDLFIYLKLLFRFFLKQSAMIDLTLWCLSFIRSLPNSHLPRTWERVSFSLQWRQRLLSWLLPGMALTFTTFAFILIPVVHSEEVSPYWRSTR